MKLHSNNILLSQRSSHNAFGWQYLQSYVNIRHSYAVAPNVISQAAIRQIQSDLQANNAEIALSISLFVIIQGSAPLVWSAISEIKGRKVSF
jgi:hypothetical protein